MQNVSILVVEDDQDINQLVSYYLQKEGYLVDSVYDGQDALTSLTTGTYQLVMLDLMLPNLDGYEVLKKIRNSKNHVPVIILSAKVEEIDKIRALGLGADDYIIKPFSIGELTARVNAQLRRFLEFNPSFELSPTHQFISSKDKKIQLNLATYQLKKGDQWVALTKKEFEILKLLMSSPTRVFTKREIYHFIWGQEFVQDDTTVMVYISRLRQKVEEDTSNPHYIQTVWGIGYKWGETVD